MSAGSTAVDVAALQQQLIDAAATVAVAESLTGGLLSAALTDLAGASAVLRGGLVVYATELKAQLAGVPADLLAERGAVDPDVASALAVGVRERLGTTYGLGVTGVAGPDPQDGQPVGTVFAGCAGPRRVLVSAHHFDGDRGAIRSAAVQAALALLARESAPGPATL